MSDDSTSVYQQFSAVRFILTIGLIALFIVMLAGFFILLASEFGTFKAYISIGGLVWTLILGFVWLRAKA